MDSNKIFGKLGYEILDNREILIFEFCDDMKTVYDIVTVLIGHFRIVSSHDGVKITIGEQNYKYFTGSTKHSENFIHSLNMDIIKHFSLNKQQNKQITEQQDGRR